jgi:hypothetical protein
MLVKYHTWAKHGWIKSGISSTLDVYILFDDVCIYLLPRSKAET